MPPSEARYWSVLENGKIRCELCPRFCQLEDGQRGLCFVRARNGHQMLLTTYGRSSGFCIDPIEKKPLNHFYPGSPILSFGTAGCNLTCKFCQNWDISKSREIETLSQEAPPDAIAEAAKEAGATSVAFTYNDPVIFLEYAVDTAKACHELGLKTVAVSAGYINPEPAREFFSHMDAAQIDLKAFTEEFYKRLCTGQLQAVLDTLMLIRNETTAWLEITTLIIPGQNDSEEEIEALSLWVCENLGPSTPLHLSAFHPSYRMQDVERTSEETLRHARELAKSAGLNFVYTGNIHCREGDTTSCPQCGTELIVRDWYQILLYQVDERGCCENCGAKLPGHFAAHAGTWGAKRKPVQIAQD